MLVANHTLQLLIPFDACAIAVTYNAQSEDFYTEASTKAKKLLPPTFEYRKTVTVTVIGNGLKFIEKYIDKGKADLELRRLAEAAAGGRPMFAFAEDEECADYERKLKKALEDAKKASTPAYKAKGAKGNG